MAATLNGTAQAWRERIALQQASGQSIRAWCRQNNHHEHAYYWWRSRLGLSPRSASKRPQRGPIKRLKFAEVVVDRASAEPLCLRLSGGRELVLPASMPVAQVVQLVRAIEGAA
jgi:hypothetical protein